MLNTPKAKSGAKVDKSRKINYYAQCNTTKEELSL